MDTNEFVMKHGFRGKDCEWKQGGNKELFQEHALIFNIYDTVLSLTFLENVLYICTIY